MLKIKRISRILMLLMAVFSQIGAAQDGFFPQSWEGRWAGNLQIFNPDGKVQDVPMQLLIEARDSAHSWAITYGEGEEAEKREYLLRPVIPERGLYSIDEQNSIVLDAIYIGGKLYSRFEVAGNLLLSMVELQGDGLHYEIISGKLEPRNITGGEEHQGEGIPEVKSYPVVVRQIAVLQRKG
ncbi:MAG: hypothetical protein H6557_08930 [Lewinellaceae bacterium]|nr:hypothetical protein [Phaeodactylibacter sp.]MCB9036728.1 hypothetical protein [Lewinellaceae bacterium]